MSKCKMPRSTYLIASLLDESHHRNEEEEEVEREEEEKAKNITASCDNMEEPLELIHKVNLHQEVPECSHNVEQTNVPSQKPPEILYRRTLPIPVVRNQLQNFLGNGSIQCLPCRPQLPTHLQSLPPYTLSCLSQLITTRSQLSQIQQAALQWSPSSPAMVSSHHLISSSASSTRQYRTNLHHRQHRFRMMSSESQSATIKKYRCDICDKTFSRSNTLVTHKRIHTGEKPFHCDHCGRAFRQPGNLTRHRLTHTTVKPYVCSVCEKAFNRASNLHTHMRIHSQAINGNIATASQPLGPFEQ